MINEYDYFADIYDIDLGKQKRDLSMYSKLVEGTKVLILTCGTGREAIYLSKYCNKVVGLDISEKMLKVAQVKSKALSNVQYFIGNIVDFKIDQAFDNIIIPNNGILHLLENDSIISCLNNCFNHLKPNGSLILDFFLPNIELLKEEKTEKIHDFTDYDEELEAYITRERVHYRDCINMTNRTQIFYEFIDKKGNVNKRICEYTIKYLFDYEFESLIRKTPFKVQNKWGGFEFQKFIEEKSYNVVYRLMINNS